MRRWRACWRWPSGAGRWRRPKQTTPQGGGGSAAGESVIIDVTALLELAAWCRQRLDDCTGRTACLTPPDDAPRPPAPEAGRIPADSPTAGVGTSASRPTAETPRTPRPT